MKTFTAILTFTFLTSVLAQSRECDCYAARLVCGNQPGANQALCSSEYAECLGYLPTDSAGAITVPTTCPTASSTAPPATTTSSGKECQCYAARLECGSKPGANQASCSSDYAACLGYIPTDSAGVWIVPSTCSATPTPSPTPSGSKECQCYAARLECGNKPGANQAFCSSEYAACLGYIPTNSQGAITAPSTCGGSSTSSASPTPTGNKECQCYAVRQSCGSKPGANQAECTAEYAACLGYAPVDSKGAVTVPSTCGTSFVPITYTPVTYTPITYTPVTYTGSTTSAPVKYTGAAANIVAGSPLIVAALAVIAL